MGICPQSALSRARENFDVMKRNTIAGIRQTFRDRVIQKTNGCWDWNGTPMQIWGYGRIKINGRPHKAHRLSYQLFVGDIPDGMLVCHKCDRPICVNPDHLFLGTDLDNQRDCCRKGRHARREGEKHPLAKLSEKDVIFIRGSAESNTQLAIRFKVAKNTIRAARLRATWGHVL